MKKSRVSLHWWQLLFSSPTDLGLHSVRNSKNGRVNEETLSTCASLPMVRNRTLMQLSTISHLIQLPPSGNVSCSLLPFFFSPHHLLLLTQSYKKYTFSLLVFSHANLDTWEDFDLAVLRVKSITANIKCETDLTLLRGLIWMFTLLRVRPSHVVLSVK